MKNIFRKAITVLGSVALIGATVGAASAASYPSPFTSNTAIVYGTGAALSDMDAVTDIAANLDANTAGSVTLTGATGVTEDQVVLGSDANSTGKLSAATLTHSKISSLLDEKLSWDDGLGSDDYDIHEELLIGGMAVYTSLNDEELTGVALTNTMDFEYRFVFDDHLNCTDIDDANADTLYLTILGQTYEVSDITATTITVVTSEEVSLGIGESATVGGKTYTVNDVFSGKAQINGEIITEGTTKKIDGLQVKVDTVGYHTNAPETSKVILKIGTDISKAYTDGDEYIGQDKNDPLWVWTISDPTADAGYIGVKFNANINDADDEDAGETIKYVGSSYLLPNNFAEIKLDGLTDVSYEDVVVSFMQRDLYNSSNSGTANEDEWVIALTAESVSSITVGGEETDEMYIWFANNASTTEVSANIPAFGAIEVFYRDHEGDNTPTGKARYETRVNLTAEATLAEVGLATIEIGETIMNVSIVVTSGIPVLRIANPIGGEINLTIGGTAIATGTTQVGTMKQLGTTISDADAKDIQVNASDVSTSDYSVMDTYGVIVARDDAKGVEGNADADNVIISVPNDQVYAIVSVNAGGEATTPSSVGVKTYADTETASFAGMNLVVVGGSAINAIAAELLGGAYSEAAFTANTDVAAGEFLIKSFTRSGKTALLVAGYNAADTEKAAKVLLNEVIDTTVGKEYKGVSSTEAIIVVA
jgi:hypothetical protein